MEWNRWKMHPLRSDLSKTKAKSIFHLHKFLSPVNCKAAKNICVCQKEMEMWDGWEWTHEMRDYLSQRQSQLILKQSFVNWWIKASDGKSVSDVPKQPLNTSPIFQASYCSSFQLLLVQLWTDPDEKKQGLDGDWRVQSVWSLFVLGVPKCLLSWRREQDQTGGGGKRVGVV